ncbi:MAG: B12-binding domain-containing radical SAM protein, partial [Thermotogaceae bacterium]|nr:B12-binding domain-containing radical SAM protein [Thermotogaceae bacterium]
MKILLINPRDSGYYYRLGAFYPPLGLAYLGAALREKGHHVKIVDMNVEDFDYKGGALSNYDVIGISSDTVRIQLACDIALEAKKMGKIVIMGGPHPSFDFARLLNMGVADYIVLGEGEKSMPELLESISKGEPYPEIDGVAYKTEEGVKVFPQKFIKNLDSLPLPDRDLLPLDKYNVKFDGKRATSIVTSRGCPFDCEFCSASQFAGLLWRRRSVESVLEEVELLYKKYNYRSLIFFDDNFTLSPERVIEISEGIVKKDMKISWWAFSRADEILGHEDMVEAMAKSGCKMLFIGF